MMLYFFHTVPLVKVHISGGGVVEFGESHVLDCAISGANNLEENIAFQWRGPNRAREESTSAQLALSTVGFSDAGIYTCTATVSSPYLNKSIRDNDTTSIIVSGEHSVICYHGFKIQNCMNYC